MAPTKIGWVQECFLWASQLAGCPSADASRLAAWYLCMPVATIVGMGAEPQSAATVSALLGTERLHRRRLSAVRSPRVGVQKETP